MHSTDTDQIHAQSLKLQDWLHDRNSLAQINRLPDELIREIMYLVRQDDIHVRCYTWIVVAQIYRRWREVALNYSALWTTLLIPLASPEWCEELSKRSGSFPLTVRITTDKRSSFHLYPPGEAKRKVRDRMVYLPQLLPLFSRIRELSFCREEGDTLEKKLLAAFGPSTNSLESLSLSKCTELDSYGQGWNCPNLQRITLMNCSVPWGSTPLLTYETIQELRIFSPSNGLSVNQHLAHLLLSLPKLQMLELEHVLEVDDPVLISWNAMTFGRGPINVASLRTLIIEEDSHEPIAHFLSQIKFHDSLRLSLFSYGDADFPELVRKVASRVFESRSRHLYDSGFHLLISGYPGDDDWEHNPMAHQLAFSKPNCEDIWFEIGVRTFSPESIIGIYSAIAGVMSVGNLTRCTITGALEAQGQGLLIHRLSDEPNLEIMVLEGDEALALVIALGDGAPRCNSHPLNKEKMVDRGTLNCHECGVLGQSWFPGIRKLLCRRTHLIGRWEDDSDERSMHPILEFSVRRLRSGLRLEEIIFEQCRFRDRDLEDVIRQEFREWCGDSGPAIWIS
ncbi:hypothetical protein AX16_004263 [Volvariella volvacea WC 439]|nr:hypothetical protein AX16_004263 [Volvariella volvacea WC 439]